MYLRENCEFSEIKKWNKLTRLMNVCNEWKLCIFPVFVFSFALLGRRRIQWEKLNDRLMMESDVVETISRPHDREKYSTIFFINQLTASFLGFFNSCIFHAVAFSASFHWVLVSKINFYYDIWATVDICFRYLNVFIQLWFEKKTVFQSRQFKWKSNIVAVK